ncbi:MAG: ATP-dependent zinc metalloprotease FtsH [Gemmatimonadales bacterium]
MAWLATAFLLVVLGQLLARGQERADLSYSDLLAQIDAGNVARVEVAPADRLVRGALRRAVTVADRSVTEFQVVLPVEDPAPLIQRLEQHDVPIEGTRGTSSWLTILVSLLPWLLLLGFWVLIARQMRSGVGGAAAFGRVGARALRADRPKVTFSDVAGADEAKAELQEIIEFLKAPARFQRLGGRMPKGVLLVGPPGTGKTLLARAVAGEAGVPFFSISGSDFVEMFVGVGAARVRDLFQTGKSSAPCIIFIDELDAVGRLRGAGLGGGHDEREQTLNQLLVELDGFEPNEGVVLLSATNRPDVLDPALLRPGRFDRQIVVDLPDVRGREQILAVHARKVPLGSDVDLAVLARGTPGLSGADLANLVNEASLLAARRGKAVVEMADFEDAKDKVMLGIERRSLVLSDAERRLTAYHEAGHALVHCLIPDLDPLHKVTIVPRGRALGLTFSLPEEDRHSYPRDYLEARLVAAFGGRVAEELVFGPERVTTGAAQDLDQATELARRMVTEFGMSDVVGPLAWAGRPKAVFLGRELAQPREMSERTADLVDGEIRRLVQEAHDRARTLLEGALPALHAVAEALLDRETLTGDEVEALRAGADQSAP